MSTSRKQLTARQQEAKSEHWLQSKWRPMMAWQYMIICLFDFMIGPIFWGIAQALSNNKGVALVQWQPLTLQGAGFYHITMATILGISAWSRGQEKMKSMDKETSAVVKEEEREEKVERVIER